MTELFEKAIARVQRLPAAEQDELAAMLLSVLDEDIIRLDPETRAAIREGVAQADRGEFASETEVARVFGRRDR